MKGTLLLLLLLSFSFCLFGQKNVLFISVDDLKPMLGAYGNTQIQTPNIDRIAARGTTFLNTSCQISLCAPSRASMLTGLYPDASGIWDNKKNFRDVNPDFLTLPQYFKRKGYVTTGAGKIFHPTTIDSLGDKVSWSEPFVKKVDKKFYNRTTGKPYNHFQNPQVRADDIAYKQYLLDNNITDIPGKRAAHSLFPFANPTTENWDVPDDAYEDGAVAKYVIRQMEELAAGTTPFFLAVGFKKPHLPFVAPKQYWDLYDRDAISPDPNQEQQTNVPAYAWKENRFTSGIYSDIVYNGAFTDEKQKELIHGYMACVSYSDALIGKLLDKLDELGLADNTIIVLWSDHGWHLGDHALWGKLTNFEQAVMSPLIIADPEIGTPGSVSESPAELIDIFPTLLDLTGLEVPSHLQGKSLVPVLEDPNAKVREANLSQFPREDNGQPVMGYTLRNDQYRYTKWVQMDYENGERYGPAIGFQLYDLDADPHETNNLIGDAAYDDVVAYFEELFIERNIAQSTISTYEEVESCNPSYEAPDGQVYTVEGLYQATLEGSNGQDSVVNFRLSIGNFTLPDTEESLTICAGESYEFGTQSLTTAGSYEELFSSQLGCDSTVVLTLTVSLVYEEEATATICAGESYQFGTQSLTVAGSYEELFSTQNGCDSTVVLTLAVNPVYEEEATATICAGESYEFGTQSLTTAGSYEELFSAQNGCDSTVVLTLAVNPVYEEEATATICGGESYEFGTQSLTVAGSYEELFTSQLGCDSVVVLTLAVNPVYEEEATATICEGESYEFGTQSLTTAGSYEELFTSQNGCDSTVVLTLAVNPVYEEEATATICEGESYEFGTQSLTTTGSYEELFNSQLGCDSTVVLTLAVKPVYEEEATATICAGESYEFGTQSLTIAGSYEELFSTQNGCDSTVVLTLAVNPVYEEEATATICAGESYEFGTQSLTVAGSYEELFSSQLGCDSTVVLTLAVSPVYEEEATATICAGESYQFGTQSLTASGSYEELFSTQNGCDSTVVLTLAVSPVYEEEATATICAGESYEFGTQSLTVAGSYEELFSAQNGCDSTVVLTLAVNPVYEEEATATICAGESYEFGTQSLTVAGSYEELFTSQLGCDSTVVLTLAVNQVYEEEVTATICAGESYEFGTQSLSVAGSYEELFTSQLGCDSLVVLTLEKVRVDGSVQRKNHTLQAGEADAVYQWYQCSGDLIEGAESRVFEPTGNGEYRVVVSKGGCEVESECIEFSMPLGLAGASGELQVELFPNPVREGELFIRLQERPGEVRVRLLDLTGRQVLQADRLNETTIAIALDVPPGVYIVVVDSGGSRSFSGKVMVE